MNMDRMGFLIGLKVKSSLIVMGERQRLERADMEDRQMHLNRMAVHARRIERLNRMIRNKACHKNGI